ncbi:NADH-quinone oxidoreductase subunit C [Meiothermus rufus]|uniref:hydrogenase large subunit n=1 Tax=Meiothermus rufus TaxID=604332 RepID=UPI0004294D48|nr:NADH-quinone oxidoreductase subunit C [Meiothermus rufus]
MDALIEALSQGRLVALDYQAPTLRYFVERAEKGLEVLELEATTTFPSLARDFPALDWFERALWEAHGLHPEGHPALKPLRDHQKPYPFDPIEGLHEVPVGPVHAGIIEPGHFRFSVLGEQILHMEVRLGYQHRGLEAQMQGQGLAQALLLAERAGGESVAHALALAQAVEAAWGVAVPPRAQVLRRVVLELERIFGHLGHLAGLFTDIGYAYAATQVGKVRALLQGQLERLTGHRYGRNAIGPGGVYFDPDRGTQDELQDALHDLGREVGAHLQAALKHPMVLDRMRYVGPVSEAQARLLGLVGPAARASGIARDLRQEDPLYQPFSPVVRSGGDVLARAQVYSEEVRQSFAYLERFLAELPSGPVWAKEAAPPPAAEGYSRVEAGRGEVFYWVRLEGARVARARLVDPSFKNWRALEIAVRGMGLPDFPLINKSFDLSYAGCDL